MSSLKPIAIIQTGHTYPQIRQHYGDFDDWIAQGLGQLSPVIRVDAIKAVSYTHLTLPTKRIV